MAADIVGYKKYGESYPWLYGRGLTGRRTAAGRTASVGVPSTNERTFEVTTIPLNITRNSTRGGGGWSLLPGQNLP